MVPICMVNKITALLYAVPDVQTEGAMTAIVALYNWIPLILLVVVVGLSFLWNMDKIMPTIKEDLSKRRAENE